MYKQGCFHNISSTEAKGQC